ncbi:MAG TPA: AMP-binding protein [Thermomicrobiaceae bacterium]|nr:AMP-binding protein [Thermomicrobiaceae bacterium]
MNDGSASNETDEIGATAASGLGFGDEIAWRPPAEALERSRLLRFMRDHGIPSYDDLLARAVAEPEWYWDGVVEHLGLEWFEPYTRVLDLRDGPAWPRWFVDGRYNYVHDAVDKWANGSDAARAAIAWEGDDGSIRRLSFADLARETNRLANALKALGVEKGDRVGIFMPMLPETAIATLACGKIGAIFTPIFSGYGIEAVASRLRDCEATLLITADGFHRRGKTIPMKETADAALAEAPSVRRVLVYRHTGDDIPWRDGRDHWWQDALDGMPDTCETEQTSGDDPYMIIYTSGTTGRPKGAVHSHAGFPIKAAHDLAFCFDLQPDDVLFWVTDLGWMMGPWAIEGSLLLGAAVLLFEGTPDYPAPDRLWRLCETHGATVLGISPTAIRALMARGDDFATGHDLSKLRAFGSTGEPWNPEPWRWLFEVPGRRSRPILNYSGGTEISGGIVGCVSIRPQKPCAFTGAVPGMAADVVDAGGDSVRGEVGELVIRAPWVGMTHGFWNDPAGERYRQSYWSRWPDVWVHGDWALIDEDGFWYILGRSDDTIKAAGKRVGPAEVESAAVAHPAVQEAAAVGVPDPVKGETIVLFTILRPGETDSEEQREAIREEVGRRLGRPLRPSAVVVVGDLPRTRSAKVMRRVMRAAYLGQDAGDLSSLENPAAVDEIRRAGR